MGKVRNQPVVLVRGAHQKGTVLLPPHEENNKTKKIIFKKKNQSSSLLLMLFFVTNMGQTPAGLPNMLVRQKKTKPLPRHLQNTQPKRDPKNGKAVEFGAGTGHLGLLLAHLRPEISMVLVEVRVFGSG